MINLDLLEEDIENAEFGISEKEIRKRSKEKRLGFDQFKKQKTISMESIL